MSALMGTFVSIKTMADGSPRLVLDMNCTLSEIASLGLGPGATFGIARINQEASTRLAQEETIKPKGGALSKLCAMIVKEERFLEFMNKKYFPLEVESEEQATDIIKEVCCINSRAELDNNKAAENIFHTTYRLPYIEYCKGN